LAGVPVANKLNHFIGGLRPSLLYGRSALSYCESALQCFVCFVWGADSVPNVSLFFFLLSLFVFLFVLTSALSLFLSLYSCLILFVFVLLVFVRAAASLTTWRFIILRYSI
jgi:hypothetical protein